MDNNEDTLAIKIQSWYRGINFRLHRLPLIMYLIQKFLSEISFQFSTETKDGRINSCLDEHTILKILEEKFNQKIKIPSYSRMWYDLCVYDNIVGWIPVNIKTSTTRTSDNTGNLAMCVYAYTDEKLNLDAQYANGSMSKILIDKLRNNKYNTMSKKDYYFIVLNKNNPRDVIVNSIKGLSVLTPNTNNIPFQVCWMKNRIFVYRDVISSIDMFIRCFHGKQNWKEYFLSSMREMKFEPKQ